MNIRAANYQDLPMILEMFVKLADHMKQLSPEINLTENRDKLIGGALMMLTFKIHDPNHCVLVMEDEGKVKGFCAGGITRLPTFSKHELVGELNWLYPMSPASAGFLTTFDAWAKQRGATARWGFAIPENKLAQRAMERDKMKLDTLQYLKVY